MFIPTVSVTALCPWRPESSCIRLWPGSRRYALLGEQPRPGAPEQHATRARLLELAGQVFADEGYAAVSVRDLARRSVAHDRSHLRPLPQQGRAPRRGDRRSGGCGRRDAPRDRDEISFRAYLTDLNRRYADRADLRALLLEGARQPATTTWCASD